MVLFGSSKSSSVNLTLLTHQRVMAKVEKTELTVIQICMNPGLPVNGFLGWGISRKKVRERESVCLCKNYNLLSDLFTSRNATELKVNVALCTFFFFNSNKV